MRFRGPPGGKHVFKMASSPVTRILTLHFWHERSEFWTSRSLRFTKVGLLQLLGLGLGSAENAIATSFCFSEGLVPKTRGEGSGTSSNNHLPQVLLVPRLLWRRRVVPPQELWHAASPCSLLTSGYARLLPYSGAHPDIMIVCGKTHRELH